MPTETPRSGLKQEYPGDPNTISYRQEIGRKALHLLTLGIPGALLLLGRSVTLPIVATIAAVALFADWARAYSASINRLILKVFGFLMRAAEEESHSQRVLVNGATWVLLGATAAILIFPEQIAAAALCMFLVGDAAAALVGRRLGRTHIVGRSKTLEGSLAFLVAAAAFSPWLPGPTPVVGLIGALVGTIAEALPIPLNDNIRVPIFAGIAMVAATWLLT